MAATVNPLLGGNRPHAACRLAEAVPVGYAELVEGVIEQLELDDLEDPLAYLQGSYRRWVISRSRLRSVASRLAPYPSTNRRLSACNTADRATILETPGVRSRSRDGSHPSVPPPGSGLDGLRARA